MTKALCAAIGGAWVLLGATPAEGFCRSTTCTGDCARDPDTECKVTGAKLFWPGKCIGFSLQKDGSVNIPLEEARPAIRAAFVAWSDLACDSGTASIAFSELDDVSCHATEYNEDGGNANIVLFQDNKWTYKGVDNTLAKTTVTFSNETGEIYDADIEINHAFNFFTVSDTDVQYDLQSVMAHEVGHLIGLDHTLDFDATMFAAYDKGSTELRTLEADDIAAACEVYAPNRPGICDPTPLRGLADECAAEEPVGRQPVEEAGGCAIPAAGPGGSASAPAPRWAPFLLVLGAAGAFARSRLRASKIRDRSRS